LETFLDEENQFIPVSELQFFVKINQTTKSDSSGDLLSSEEISYTLASGEKY
jgi:hypothetical protein